MVGGSDKSEVADKLGGFLAGGRGLYWRRWLEAGLLTGDVTPQMLLDCPINGVYDFFKCMGQEKVHFLSKINMAICASIVIHTINFVIG